MRKLHIFLIASFLFFSACDKEKKTEIIVSIMNSHQCDFITPVHIELINEKDVVVGTKSLVFGPGTNSANFGKYPSASYIVRAKVCRSCTGAWTSNCEITRFVVVEADGDQQNVDVWF